MCGPLGIAQDGKLRAQAAARHTSCKYRVSDGSRARRWGESNNNVVFVTGMGMAIDLKSDWTAADVSALLASVEDDRTWRLEVSADGLARLNDLSTVPSAAHEEALHCFFEIWDQGTDFVGPGAACDKSLCNKIEKILRENYPALKGARTLSAL
jgi:hypothetical protein